MKIYVKDAQSVLVEATPEQMFNIDLPLFYETGTEYKRPSFVGSSTLQAPGIITTVEKDKDPIVQLSNMIAELANTVKSQNAIKDQVEIMKEQLAAYGEMTKRGFVLPNSQILGNSPVVSQIGEGCLKKVNLAIQGERLVNKQFYPNYQLTEKSRQEVATYFCRVMKAHYERNFDALAEIEKNYGHPSTELKTAIGDTGNTFPIPDIVESEVLAFARESSLALQYARVETMTSDKQSYPAESGSATISWGETTGNSDPTVTEVELDSEVLSAYTIVKQTTLDDSPSDIVSWVFANMSEATGLELDNIMFNGDGTSTYANCSGILTAAVGYSVTLGSSSTAFSQLSATDLSNMIGQIDGMKKIGAMFFFHGTNLHYVRTLKDSNNALIFQATVGSALPSTIWNYGYKEAIKCPSTSASNTAFGVFGNLKYFMLGRRKGVTALQMDPYGLWTTNKIRMKMLSRFSGRIGLANGFCRVITNS